MYYIGTQAECVAYNLRVGEGEKYNVSVQEVGQDWTLGTGWSIGEDKATFENSSGAGNISQYNVLEATKSYKLTFDTLEATGILLILLGVVIFL